MKPETFLDGDMKLMKLERLQGETGKVYTEVVKSFSDRQREVEGLEKKTDSANP